MQSEGHRTVVSSTVSGLGKKTFVVQRSVFVKGMRKVFVSEME